MSEEIVVFVTTGSEDEAARIAKKLVGEKLAACVNILPGVRSIFQWQGKVCEENETLMIIKTHDRRFKELERTVKEEHSYDVPEIIALPILAGSKEYLGWIREETGSASG